MTNCKLCIKKPVWKFTNKNQLCKKHFCFYFERKILATIRKLRLRESKLKKQDDLRYKVLRKVIEKIITGKGKTLNINNLDDFSIKILSSLLKKANFKPLFPKTSPLYFLSDKEIILYAKINKIKGKIKRKLNKKEQEIDSFLIFLESNNPDIRHNVVNSLSRLN